ncbi:hypothetical protein OFC51_31575, partial [Escherichia coli]|nr:hypothetical protein [Escherichia coli]
ILTKRDADIAVREFASLIEVVLAACFGPGILPSAFKFGYDHIVKRNDVSWKAICRQKTACGKFSQKKLVSLPAFSVFNSP